MLKMPPVFMIFGALSAMFLGLVLMDVRKHGSISSPARKGWLRIGLIFAAVSAYLLFEGRHL
jgi:hypothetical protein